MDKEYALISCEKYFVLHKKKLKFEEDQCIAKLSNGSFVVQLIEYGDRKTLEQKRNEMNKDAETEQPIADLPANTEVNAITYPENESLANEPVLVDSEKTSGELLLQECGDVEVQETVSALIEGKNDIDSSLGASEKSIGNICDSKADIQSTDAALTSDESGGSDSELIPFEVSTTDSNFEPTDKDKNSSDSSDDSNSENVAQNKASLYGTIRRVRWTADEKQELIELFGDLKSLQKLPSLQDAVGPLQKLVQVAGAGPRTGRDDNVVLYCAPCSAVGFATSQVRAQSTLKNGPSQSAGHLLLYDFMLKERVRSRKQKPGESFTAFYDYVLSLMDRVAIKIDEEELSEILKNNLLPVRRHKLHFEVIESVGHLRRLVQMNENLIKELRTNSTDIADAEMLMLSLIRKLIPLAK
ncbi:hypothetical protein ACLKA6_000429 [Drosophila palustris]